MHKHGAAIGPAWTAASDNHIHHIRSHVTGNSIKHMNDIDRNLRTNQRITYGASDRELQIRQM